MNIVTLSIKNEAPLLPPGVTTNQSGPVEKLVNDFHSWLEGRNHAHAVMEPSQIYDQLFHLLGGKRTPENIGHVPRFHCILNDAYHRIIGTLANQPQGNGGVLLPPELNRKS
jgi:hypothetical protein